MILCLVFSYLLGGSLATNDSTEMSGSSDISKSIMCAFLANVTPYNLTNMDLATIPSECEVLIYYDFIIDVNSIIYADEAYIKSMVDSNKPVIVAIYRDMMYVDWGHILTKEGNAKDAKVLCEYALKNNISGYIISDITIGCASEDFKEELEIFILPYLKQLKCSPDFIIGFGVEVFPSDTKNRCKYNFTAMNDLVNYYQIRTAFMNECDPKLYNGMSPLSGATENNTCYLLGMEEVATFLKNTSICLTKLNYDIELSPADVDSLSVYASYSQVCTGKLNVSSSCIQTTTNLYEKGKFVSEQNSGASILFIDLDDFQNDCRCEPFIGVKNIVAGVKGGKLKKCEKFDIQSGEFEYK